MRVVLGDGLVVDQDRMASSELRRVPSRGENLVLFRKHSRSVIDVRIGTGRSVVARNAASRLLGKGDAAVRSVAEFVDQFALPIVSESRGMAASATSPESNFACAHPIGKDVVREVAGDTADGSIGGQNQAGIGHGGHDSGRMATRGLGAVTLGAAIVFEGLVRCRCDVRIENGGQQQEPADR